MQEFYLVQAGSLIAVNSYTCTCIYVWWVLIRITALPPMDSCLILLVYGESWA